MLGMYVHTHWGYNHPYAARTWSLEDWRGYLSGLQKLGFNLVMFWPLADSMPPQPTASDLAFLERIAQVIDMAHNQFGMKFWITLGPNVMGNERAASYHYEERPYFICERKVNPADAQGVAALLAARQWQLEPLRHADGLVIIDGDPGGYIGSTDAEFVDLLKAQIGVFRQFHPGAELVYWIWFGWQNYNRFWAEANQLPAGAADPPLHIELPTFIHTLNGIKAQIAEPWSLLGAFPQHLEATSATGVGDRLIHIPYGAVEGEPSFPLTNYTPTDLRAVFEQHPAGTTFPRGVMANAQAHCLQLPHTYLFSRWAQGGLGAALDLPGFAEGLLPGLGEKITTAWSAIGCGSAAQQRCKLSAAARSIWEETGKTHAVGEYAGFLFGDPDRFLEDLAMNLEVRASLADLQQAIENGGSVKQAVQGVLDHLVPYQQCLGFTDAYMGPLYQMLNEPLARLGDTGIDAVLAQFHDWRSPAVRNGVVPRLFEAMATYSTGQFETLAQWLIWLLSTDLAGYRRVIPTGLSGAQADELLKGEAKLHRFFKNLLVDMNKNPACYAIPEEKYEPYISPLSTLSRQKPENIPLIEAIKTKEAKARDARLKVRKAILGSILDFLYKLGQMAEVEGDALKVDLSQYNQLVSEKTKKIKSLSYAKAFARVGLQITPGEGAVIIRNEKYPGMTTTLSVFSKECAKIKDFDFYFFRRCDFGVFEQKRLPGLGDALKLVPASLRGGLEETDALLTGLKFKREIISTYYESGVYRIRYQKYNDKIVYWVRIREPFNPEMTHNLRWKLESDLTPRLFKQLDETNPGLADVVFNGFKKCLHCYEPCGVRVTVERNREMVTACQESGWNIGLSHHDFAGLRIVIKTLNDLF